MLLSSTGTQISLEEISSWSVYIVVVMLKSSDALTDKINQLLKKAIYEWNLQKAKNKRNKKSTVLDVKEMN